MLEKLRVGIVQADLVWENPVKNRKHFEEQIDHLSKEVDLIVLPEMFPTGFSMNARELAEPVDGTSFQWMRKMASKKDAAITGSIITSDNGKYYNRLFFVYPDGSFEKYDKRHTFTLAKEDQTYESGTERLVLNYKDWKICPLVCYDLRFPVWSRNTVDYDVLIYVANWPAPRVHAWDTLLKARAIENMAYCIGVNRTGSDDNGHSYIGHSAVYDSLGKAVSEENIEEEFTKEVLIERTHLSETRGKLKFLQDRDSFTLN